MTQLLVSVRDVDEARLALDAGADLIDLKEPRRGPLGPVDCRVMQDVVELVDGRRPVSAALGELVHWDRHVAGQLPEKLAFAKFGLAGCAKLADWPRHQQAALGSLPAATAAVAVVYADWQLAQAPDPQQVLNHGLRLGCRAVLVDTFDKSGSGLVSCWTAAEIGQFVEQARGAGAWVALAGSLRRADLPQVLAANPDCIAVRGAVCRPSRDGLLDAQLLRTFRADLPSCQQPQSAAGFSAGGRQIFC